MSLRQQDRAAGDQRVAAVAVVRTLVVVDVRRIGDRRQRKLELLTLPLVLASVYDTVYM